MNEPLRLQSREIVGARPGPHLLITGGVHGDEFEPMAAIRHLIRELSPESVTGRVTLVPVVNEPAFWRGHRTGEDNLDLARICPGEENGGPSQRIAYQLSQMIQTADFYIDLHTGGTEYSVIPLVGYCLHADSQVLDQQRRMARAFNLPTVWGTSGNLPGRSLSVARDAGVPALYTEYHGSATYGPAGATAYFEGCLNVMRELGMLNRPTPASAIERIVEDPRDSSGHMQICNPAPFDGFFTSAVTLGERVTAGQPLGTVCNILGDREETIESTQSGLILTLRTFPRVKAGDSVGVILETDEFGVDV